MANNINIDHAKRMFQDVRATYEKALNTPLNIVICGPGKPDDSNPAHPYYLREQIKNEFINNGDNAFYIEDYLKTEDGKRILEELRIRLGDEPDLRDIELFILNSQETDKDIHLAESLGSFIELRDFEDFPSICHKIKIFITESHANKPSYAATVITRLRQKGARIYSYNNSSDLLIKVKESVKRNRINKYRSSLGKM